MLKDEAVLLVDNDQFFLDVYQGILGKRYRVFTALDGQGGINALKQLDHVAVIISDYKMHEIDGDFFLEAKKCSPDSVQIMLSATADSDILLDAINRYRVFRFLVKPLVSEELIELIDEGIKEYNRTQYSDVLGRESCQTAQPLLTAMTERDPFIAGYVDRVTELCYLMGLEMGLSKQHLANLMCLTLVHDIGNLVIPDSIIFKEGSLTRNEWNLIRQHPVKGYRIAVSAPDFIDIADLILKHHERWDGQGYPFGLKGKEIPLECRILQIANAYDVMTNDRPYKKAKSKDEALKEIKQCTGSQFDPEIVELFFTVDKYGSTEALDN